MPSISWRCGAPRTAPMPASSGWSTRLSGPRRRWRGWRDTYAIVFLAVTLALAGAAWAVSGDPIRAVAVLVVATPCPLLLAVPIALVAGLSRAAKQGVPDQGRARAGGAGPDPRHRLRQDGNAHRWPPADRKGAGPARLHPPGWSWRWPPPSTRPRSMSWPRPWWRRRRGAASPSPCRRIPRRRRARA